MLGKIGPPAAPAGAVELLLECHGRIRMFLATARRLAAPGDDPAEEVAEAARGVHRYFAGALPLHARDEEESLLPRLRGRDPALDEALAVMARQHAEHQEPLRALLAACAELAREPARRAALAPALAAAAGELERHFADHLAREEASVFPALRRWLDAAEKAALVREIRARRQG